jgi:hypothetical protein
LSDELVTVPKKRLEQLEAIEAAALAAAEAEGRPLSLTERFQRYRDARAREDKERRS